MDLSKKMICYRQPKRGHTLDEWEVKIEAVPTEAQSFVMTYNSKEYSLSPCYSETDRTISLRIGVDAEYPVEKAMRSNRLDATVLRCELFEPLGGWSDHISWDLTQSSEGRKTS